MANRASSAAHAAQQGAGVASDERKVRDSFLQERDFGMYSLCAISLSYSGSWRGPDDVSSAYAIGRSIRICRL
jgi:hypothetical protein